MTRLQGGQRMVHVTCDLCGKDIREEMPYSVCIEIRAARKPAVLVEADLEDDHLEALSQSLQAQADSELHLGATPARETLHFDLCPACRDRFAKDPLNREPALDMDLDFSAN